MWTARPAPALRAWVSGYTGWRSETGPPVTHQGVASGHLTLILCWEGAVELVANPDPSRPPGTFGALLSGLYDAPAVIRMGPAQTGVQLDLTWRGARSLLGLPAAEVSGDTVDLAAVLPGTEELRARLAAAPDWPARFALLDAALLAVAAERDAADGRPEVAYAWDRLARTGGGLRIEELARETGWSRRHLAARFRAETGLSPKAAARVIRFERACRWLRGTPLPLADVAARCGFADQQHLAREFRDLAGQTASSWRAERVDQAPARSAAGS